MRRSLTFTAALAVAATTLAAAPAAQQQQPADPAHEVELAIGETGSSTGTTAGIGPWNFAEDNYRCDASPEAQCEVTLVKLSNPYEEENAKKGRERANLNLVLSSTVPVGDLALQVWESDESGARGDLVGTADENPQPTAGWETMSIVTTSTPEVTEFWYRVEVIYWAHAGDYTLDLEYTQ